jgi:hypothetical protein
LKLRARTGNRMKLPRSEHSPARTEDPDRSASDEEFDFGTEQWDLITILYPIEKRSVYRVRQALRVDGGCELLVTKPDSD